MNTCEVRVREVDEVDECDGKTFDSTFAAIQQVVFENYGCTNAVCHGGGPQGTKGGLRLNAGDSYANLVGVASANYPLRLVEPGEPQSSLLYLKLAKATLGDNFPVGSSMPSGLPALTPDLLDGVELWIRKGAEENKVVDGTAGFLSSCLPSAQPLTIPPPQPPGAGVGVQLRQTPWDLPGQSQDYDGEDEVCMGTYYDLTKTNLVPDSAKVPCPPEYQFGRTCSGGDSAGEACTDDSDCPGTGGICVTTKNALNPSSECFAYNRQVLVQDPQSHHSIIHNYTGGFDTSDPGWGPWTKKFQDLNHPDRGMPCDPTDVDPATGYNADCSSEVWSGVACVGDFGPPDYTQGIADLFNGSSNAPMIGGSQEPFYEQSLADGVYAVLPMKGIIVWNSHAFNLTSIDSTMSQYWNLDFARGPEEQRYPVLPIFDATSIFIQDVPPFETREYCRTYTIDKGARLFHLSSHTHLRGVRFRIWEPPNATCAPEFQECLPGDPDQLIYVSTEYSDPVQLAFPSPIAHDSTKRRDRTYLFCSLYDNGSTPSSPPVKRYSTSPEPPSVLLQFLGLGGPCEGDEVMCLDGPNKGALCGLDNSLCPESVCDACPIEGGVTTEDEMFIMLGFYYIP